MKKILFFFALLTLAFGASAQTPVSILPSNEAGTVEAYPAIADITYDTTFTYDTVGDVVDTIINITADTTFVPNFYVYHAVASPGYHFEKWEVIIAHDSIYDVDSNQWVDYVYSDTITQSDIEITETDTFDYAGWLEWEIGIPDLNDTTIEGITSITINAYFVQDSSVGVGEVAQQSYQVYPNPTAGTINVLGDVHWITVYDMSGRVVTSTDSPVINLQGWPNGTYLVRVTDTKGNMGITKVIKQ